MRGGKINPVTPPRQARVQQLGTQTFQVLQLRADADQLLSIHLLDHCGEDRILIRKQQIKSRSGDFASFRNVAHGGSTEAVSAEYLSGSFDHALMLAGGGHSFPIFVSKGVVKSPS
jgi:hypothetical protein